MEIKIGKNAVVRTERQGEWVVLLVEDGSGAKATVSLAAQQAMDLGKIVAAQGVTAANTQARIKPKYTPSRIADIECPSCRARRDTCRLCGGSGVVTEQQARDWPAVP